MPRVPLFALAHEVPDKRAGLRAEDVFGPEHLMGRRLEHVEATDSILIELKPIKGRTVIAGGEVVAE